MSVTTTTTATRNAADTAVGDPLDGVTKPIPGGTVRRLGHALGARVDGIRLSGDLQAETVEALRTELATHKVLIFPGQFHVDDTVQREFAALLGTPTQAHPTVHSTGLDVLRLEQAASSWHSDVTFVDRVPKTSILRPSVLPPYGGATLWASTTAAYAGLPDSLRAFVDGAWAVHTNTYDYAAQVAGNGHRGAENTAYYTEFTRDEYETEHPVVRVHPETGERSLVLGHFVKRFRDLGTLESATLLQLLQQRITRPDNTFRWDWALGDIAVWDNRATQHYGLSDHGDQPRIIHRVTLAGDVPVSIDGERSQVLLGDASDYSVIETPRPLVGFEPAPAGLAIRGGLDDNRAPSGTTRSRAAAGRVA